jgi:hypothetical protein
MLQIMHAFARGLAGVLGFATVALVAFAGSGPALAGVEGRGATLTTREDRPRSCSAALSVKQTSTAAGCWIDERVTGAPGKLDFPCEGGAATATFGKSRFGGRVQGGAVSVGLKTRFNWSDGCVWESTQEITGTLSDGTLTFSYSEAPLPDQTGCASSCAAQGAVEVR